MMYFPRQWSKELQISLGFTKNAGKLIPMIGALLEHLPIQKKTEYSTGYDRILYVLKSCHAKSFLSSRLTGVGHVI